MCVVGAQAVQRFAVADLSNWYLDVIKDRLYVSAPDSFDRRAAQTVLHALLQARSSVPGFMATLPPCPLFCTTQGTVIRGGKKIPADPHGTYR